MQTPPVDSPSKPLLQVRNIAKAFAGVQALKGVDFDLRAGEVHALMGENGAGKSTFMKILFGVQRPDSGTIEIDGHGEVAIADPRHALALGIGLVAQEPSLVPQLDVAQNIFLGQTEALGVVPRRHFQARAREILKPLAPRLPVTARVGSLGMADVQVVEIARTLARGGRIIGFDEPTSSLTPAERDGLFALIRQLKESGKGIIYISHRIPEVYAVCDRVTVLRDGRVVASRPIQDVNPDELITLIAGRRLAEELQHARASGTQPGGTDALRLENVSVEGKLHGINLSLRHGEIFGLAGLVGSGRTELARCIFGADPKDAGTLYVNGKALDIRHPSDAIAAGIALIPEDRRKQALVPVMDVERNFGLANYRQYAPGGFLRLKQRRHDANRYIEEMAIRPRRAEVRIRNLSGGNQQKVIIARWLQSGARIFLFDEPTRGIDVGAKFEIHQLMRRLAKDGCALLVISSELPEVLALCDRVGVMREGRLAQTIDDTSGLNEDLLMKYASGEVALP
ncbi:MAG: sugar ABC transporter ATP-binding protein [Verrucomicrobia bacterium]|nr:sugar ABC transporter ATP-binding protein [Verrucomicrobiota bacterium]